MTQLGNGGIKIPSVALAVIRVQSLEAQIQMPKRTQMLKLQRLNALVDCHSIKIETSKRSCTRREDEWQPLLRNVDTFRWHAKQVTKGQIQVNQRRQPGQYRGNHIDVQGISLKYEFCEHRRLK